MKNIIVVLLLSSLFSSCNNWLDMAPENERLSGEYWTNEDDVKNTMMSCYTRMRECVNSMLFWGELRADVFVLHGTDVDLDKMRKHNLNSDNKNTKWNDFYSVINVANGVIQYAPQVLKKDPLFTELELDCYIAEAKIVRSLMYFYLVRTFRDVPLVTEAYFNDIQSMVRKKDLEKDIINQLILDIQWSLKRLKTGYDDGFGENKCRATLWGAQMLLADILLWDEQYDKCLNVCELILKSGRVELMGQENWFDNFYPGLTRESVWELYFDHENDQKNELRGHKLRVRQEFRDRFDMIENKEDVRGIDASFNKSGQIWKYLGIGIGTDQRPSEEHSPNWIFYRYAEVYLMYAEACVMHESNAPELKMKAVNAINKIRGRAGAILLEDDAVNFSQQSWIEIILDERKKEFIGEGKRWFDLIRVAKKEEYSLYKQSIIDILLDNVPFVERAIYQTKLSNPYSLFLPIHKNEIDAGKGVLEQNPAYN